MRLTRARSRKGKKISPAGVMVATLALKTLLLIVLEYGVLWVAKHTTVFRE